MENSQHTSKDQPKAEGVVKDGAGPGQVQAALRESEERYRSVFEQSIDAVLLTAPDGRILAANPAACQLFGRSEADLRQVGRTGVVGGEFINRAVEERTRRLVEPND